MTDPPRFTTAADLLATPMAALEFALGELFRGDWTKEIRHRSHDYRRRREILKKRFLPLTLNEWQSKLVDRTYDDSPWMRYKADKLRRSLFL